MGYKRNRFPAFDLPTLRRFEPSLRLAESVLAEREHRIRNERMEPVTAELLADAVEDVRTLNAMLNEIPERS